MTHRLQNFPHPTPFFGFNTSCFWRRNVLYLYRDMGGASAPPFFRHFPFKIGDLEAHPGKIRGRQRKIRGRQRKIWGRERKTMRQIGNIGRRKVFSEVKNVNVKSRKNGSILLDFWSGSLPQPHPKGKGFSNFNMRFRAGFCVGFWTPQCRVLNARSVGLETPQCRVLDARCVGFWTLAV